MVIFLTEVQVKSACVCAVDTTGPSRWNRTPTWSKWEWLLILSCSNGFTIPEIRAVRGLSPSVTLVHANMQPRCEHFVFTFSRSGNTRHGLVQ